MPKVKLDHCVIHVSEWDRSNAFYRDVMGADVIQMANRWVYRFGDTQLNLHGPGLDAAPVARLPVQPGNSDLCFEWPGPIDGAVAHLDQCEVPIELGPIRAAARRAMVRVCISATRTDRFSNSFPTRDDGY